MAGGVAGVNSVEPGRAVWDEVEAALIDVRASVYSEIRAYPKPITACDAQYNYLLEQRAEVGQLLARLQRAGTGEQTDGEKEKPVREMAQAISAFLATSSMIEKDARRELLERVRSAEPQLTE